MKILAIAAAMATGLIIWFIQSSCSVGTSGDSCNMAKGLSFWFWPLALLIFWVILLTIRFVMRLLTTFFRNRNLDLKNE